MNKKLVLALCALLAAGLLLLQFKAGWGLSPQPNTIRWATQSEQASFGYDVYRGPSQEGPFRRITPRPLAGAGTTDLPSNYQFVDDRIARGEVYWYYVESISMDGSRERITPVYASKPR